MRTLRQDPDLMPSAIEELLRFDTPVQMVGRTAIEDTEIGGRRVTTGQGLVLLLGAANRDPDVFSQPEQLNIRRNEASTISFGRGLHHCLGASLARLEGRIAFEAMLERFADIRLLTDRVWFRDAIVLRGLRALPISAT